MTEGALCVGRRAYDDVVDTDTAGALRPRSPDGHPTDDPRLPGALSEVRHYGTDAGNVGRSAESAVGAGAAEQEKVMLLPLRSAVLGTLLSRR